ncbi:MAG: hypothetical protein MJ238_06050, partial [Bacilli bacterium]|nr:hypothetical protein [Bacilli bacterium]
SSISADGISHSSDTESSSSFKTRTSKSGENNSSSKIFSSTSKSEEIVSSSLSSNPQIPDNKIYTIAEVKELCKKVTGLNESGIAVDSGNTFTIRGLAISKFSLVKTTSKFGLDKSSPYKILVGDETGYIVVASSFSNDGNTLWGKLSDHAGKITSKYTITGYLSMYLNQPELYVSGKTFTWDENLDTNVDYKKYAKDVIDLDSFYDEAVNVNYNCAGHGYGEIHKVEGVRCFDQRDNVYFFTNGKSVMKVIKGLASFSVGSTYDLYGYVSTNSWVPSLYCLEAIKSANSVNLDLSYATPISIADFKKNKCSKDDTISRLDSYIRFFKNMYSSTVYMDAYTENGKYYVTMGDTFIANENVSSNHLVNHISYNQIAISNDNYWNTTIDQIERFNPHAEDVFSDRAVDVIYYPYIQEWGSYGGKNNQPIWKVMLLNNYA